MTASLIPMSFASTLHGTVPTEAEIAALRENLPSELLPEWWIHILRTYKLGGMSHTLPEHVDLSGLGAELFWLTPMQIVDEAINSEPGISVCPLGFLPIAGCAIGMGDPYFLDLRDPNEFDPPLVRVLHDFGGSDETVLISQGVELVVRRFSDLFGSLIED